VTKLVLLIEIATVYSRNLVIIHKKPHYLYSVVKRFKTFKTVEMEMIGVSALHCYRF
jgi:hypothetical protein